MRGHEVAELGHAGVAARYAHVTAPLRRLVDRFATEVPLPDLAVGELVAVLNAGAYGLTFSPARFLGHPSPAEVLVDAAGPRLVRRRGEPADVLADQLP